MAKQRKRMENAKPKVAIWVEGHLEQQKRKAARALKKRKIEPSQMVNATCQLWKINMTAAKLPTPRTRSQKLYGIPKSLKASKDNTTKTPNSDYDHFRLQKRGTYGKADSTLIHYQIAPEICKDLSETE